METARLRLQFGKAKPNQTETYSSLINFHKVSAKFYNNTHEHLATNNVAEDIYSI